MKKEISKAAATMGRKGGAVKGGAKASAARENGAKGGRPRKYIPTHEANPVIGESYTVKVKPCGAPVSPHKSFKAVWGGSCWTVMVDPLLQNRCIVPGQGVLVAIS
jgi:hypothetical protein